MLLDIKIEVAMSKDSVYGRLVCVLMKAPLYIPNAAQVRTRMLKRKGDPNKMHNETLRGVSQYINHMLHVQDAVAQVVGANTG